MPGKSNVYRFLDTEIEALTSEDFLSRIDNFLNRKYDRSAHVALINAYCATLGFQDGRIGQIYREADLTVPDGRPFVYWMRWFLRRPCEQLDATTVIHTLAAHARQTGYRFYLYGGHPDVLERMKSALYRLYPHVNIVGYKSPPFRKLTSIEEKKDLEEINALAPDIILVGLGTPKQDLWIYHHKTEIAGAVLIPCGAVFDFFGGRIKRAPRIISILGMEWLFRLLSKDFERLLKRYTITNAIFVWYFGLQLIGRYSASKRN